MYGANLFEENDERKSIHLKLSNMSNDEIVTIITPIDNKENKLDSLLSESYEIKNKVKSKLNNIEIENLNLKNKLIERLEMWK